MIKTIFKHPEWEEIEEMLLDDFSEKPINLKTEGKSNEQIASEARGREFSAKAIKKFLNKINRLKNPIDGKKRVYR